MKKLICMRKNLERKDKVSATEFGQPYFLKQK